MDQFSGPTVTIPDAPSLTNQPVKPDLLSSDLRRKIRRTGFSSILSFPSVDDNVQGNILSSMNRITQTSEKRILLPDGNGGQQKILHGPRVSVPSPTLSVSITSTNTLKPALRKDPDELDLRGMTSESVYPGRR